MKKNRLHIISITLGMLLSLPLSADWMDDAGVNELLEYMQLDPSSDIVPTILSSNVPVAMVEGGANYMPVTGSGTFVSSGRTYVNVSDTSPTASSHAATVAGYYFSTTRSFATGADGINCYSANDFINNTLAINNDQLQPMSSRVASHAYIANLPDTTVENLQTYSSAIHRYDYLASVGNTVMVAGLNNGGGTTVPDLFGMAYNAISVGVTGSGHSTGDTTSSMVGYNITAGRTKPEIVSNASATSWATGQVSSGVTYIHGLADSLSYTTITNNTDLQRAILLAGATKEEFAGWKNASTDPTETRPLDPTYGAGEMNIFQSHRIVEGGAISGIQMGYHGWTRDNVATTSKTYDLVIPAEAQTGGLSIMLCWNRLHDEVVSGPLINRSYSYDPQDLADLRLTLSGGGLATPVVSDSSLDNLEHIYALNLAPGTYQVTVSNNTGSTLPSDFGLAWRVNLAESTGPCLQASTTGLAFLDLIPGIRYEIWESDDLATWTFQDEFIAASASHAWTAPAHTDTRKFYRLKYWGVSQ